MYYSLMAKASFLFKLACFLECPLSDIRLYTGYSSVSLKSLACSFCKDQHCVQATFT